MGYEMTIPFASVEHLFAWKLETHQSEFGCPQRGTDSPKENGKETTNGPPLLKESVDQENRDTLGGKHKDEVRENMFRSM